jgi:hypothetical protein
MGWQIEHDTEREYKDMTKVARLMGCVAAAWLFGAGIGNAATISFIAATGAATNAPALSNPQNIAGTATGTVGLVFTTDTIEFSVTPNTGTATVVNVLNDPGTGTPSFPNEFFRIVRDTTGGAIVLAATAATNTAVVSNLVAGVNYFLEFNSDTPVGNTGLSTFHVQVPLVPLPGALVLFGTVLGAGGLLMRRRRDRAAAAV